MFLLFSMIPLPPGLKKSVSDRPGQSQDINPRRPVLFQHPRALVSRVAGGENVVHNQERTVTEMPGRGDAKGAPDVSPAGGEVEAGLGLGVARPEKMPPIERNPAEWTQAGGEQKRLVEASLPRFPAMQGYGEQEVVVDPGQSAVPRLLHPADSRLSEIGAASVLVFEDERLGRILKNESRPRPIIGRRIGPAAPADDGGSDGAVDRTAAEIAEGAGDPDQTAETGGTEIIAVVENERAPATRAGLGEEEVEEPKAKPM
jgi:hypothetical protein